MTDPPRQVRDEASKPQAKATGENGRSLPEKETIQDLLLRCLSIGSGVQEVDPPGEVSTGHWEILHREATRHGIAPLLYHRLRPHVSRMGIPADALEKLQQQYLLNRIKNTRIYHEFSKIVRSMKNQGILLIPLKGIYLAEAVYDSPALRSMRDLDLLVKKSDLKKTEEVLSELGYGPVECNRVIADDNYHFTYFHGKTRLQVEIHWAILPPNFPYNVDIEGLWKRSRTAVIDGNEVLVFSPEDQILFLCSHMSKHAFQVDLRSVVDLVETANHFKKEMDWAVLRTRAHQWGAVRSVYLALRLARELAEADVPEQLIEGLKPTPFEERIFVLARDGILGQRAETGDGLILSPNVAQLWSDKGVLEKVVLIFKRIFPSRHWMGRRYPARPDSLRIFLYYPVYVKKLLFHNFRQSWRLLRGEKEMVTISEEENAVNALRDWVRLS